MVWVCRTLTPDALCAVETGGLDRGCYLAGIGRAMSDEAPKQSCLVSLDLLAPSWSDLKGNSMQL